MTQNFLVKILSFVLQRKHFKEMNLYVFQK